MKTEILIAIISGCFNLTGVIITAVLYYLAETNKNKKEAGRKKKSGYKKAILFFLSAMIISILVLLFFNKRTLPPPINKLILNLPFDGVVKDNNYEIYSSNLEFVLNRNNEKNKAVYFNGENAFIAIKNHRDLNIENDFSIVFLDLQRGKIRLLSYSIKR